MPSVNSSMMNSVLESSFAMKIAEKLLEFVSKIPESQYSKTEDAQASASKLKQRSCTKAAATSAALAFPVGPVGWITIVPELLAVWRIQARMVADIAAMHGQSDKLTKEVMLYCLFNHSASQALKDVTARVGERAFLRSTSSSMARQITARVGTRFTQKAVQRMVTRWVPVIGALGMGAYVYYDTNKVAKTTMAYFANPFPINDEKLAQMMENAHANNTAESDNKVDQLADTVKKKAEDLASKAKDHWQHYRETASDALSAGAEKADEYKQEVAEMAGRAKNDLSQQAESAKDSVSRAMAQGKDAIKDAAKDMETSDSPIVAGNRNHDTFKPSEPSKSATSTESNSDLSKSGLSRSQTSDSKLAKDDRSHQKQAGNVPPSQTNPNRDQPHNGLYQ